MTDDSPEFPVDCTDDGATDGTTDDTTDVEDTEDDVADNVRAVDEVDAICDANRSHEYRWRCTGCKALYEDEPKRCERCGATEFRQYREM